MKILEGAVFAVILFTGVLVCMRAGWMLGRRRIRIEGTDVAIGLGAVDSAVFALMGLLIAFTFTGAAARFDGRRDLITQEVNAIGTAWLRLDLLQDDARAEVRDLFRRYVDNRIAVYAVAVDSSVRESGSAEQAKLQQAIWTRLVAAAMSDPSPRTASTVLPAVNAMFDIANERLLATRKHPPLAVYLMLGSLVLVSGLLAGFGMAKAKSQSMLHLVGFAAVLGISVYLIIDMEFPRLGLLRVDTFDRAMVELRESMK
jgi:hypothetical protein